MSGEMHSNDMIIGYLKDGISHRNDTHRSMILIPKANDDERGSVAVVITKLTHGRSMVQYVRWRQEWQWPEVTVKLYEDEALREGIHKKYVGYRVAGRFHDWLNLSLNEYGEISDPINIYTIKYLESRQDEIRATSRMQALSYFDDKHTEEDISHRWISRTRPMTGSD